MNRELIKEASDVLMPLSVNIRDLNVDLDEDYDNDINADVEFHAFFRFNLFSHKVINKKEVDKEHDLVKVYFKTGIRLLPVGESDLDNFVVQIDADFVATYAVNGKLPSEEAIVEFGKYNSPLHIWPYWRELLQNLGDRIGFGAVVLPMYRVPSASSNEDDEERPSLNGPQE